MSFQLPPNPEAEAILLAETLAKDAVAVASQFDSDVVVRYRAMYENYWKLSTSFTLEQLQARSDRMGPTELAILLKAGGFVQALLTMGAPLEAKYHTLPREYSIVNVTFADGHTEASIANFNELYALMQQHGPFTNGKLTLGELIGDWAPVVEEPQPEESSEPTPQ